MAHLLRLIAAVVLMALAGPASALIPTVPAWNVAPDPGRYPTRELACAGWVIWANANAPPVPSDRSWSYEFRGDTLKPDAYVCVTRWRSTAGQVTGYVSSPEVWQISATTCPVNSAASGSACACAAGYVENSGKTACDVAPSGSDRWKTWCTAANNQSLGNMKVSGKSLAGGCLDDINIAGSPINTPGYQAGDVPSGGGCTFSFTDAISYQHPDGGWETQGVAKVSGGTCTTAAVPTTAPVGTTQQADGAKNPCPNGYPGTVNGVEVCAKQDPTSGIEGAGSTSTTNTDGSSTTVGTTTSCTSGQCTTTTTTTSRASTAAGGATTTGAQTVTESIGSLCARSPSNKVCAATGAGDGNGGDSFTGSCAAGFNAVSDDPVVNAMALEMHRRNCQLFETPTEERTAYEADKAKGKAGTDQTLGLPGNTTVNLSSSNFDASDAIGGAGCITDLPIVVMNRTVVLPLSGICPFLAYMGIVLQAVAFLLAARIVTRG